MQVQRCTQPSATNSPKASAARVSLLMSMPSAPPVGGVSVVGAVVSDRSRRVPQASCLACPVLAATVRLVTWLVVPLACFLVRCQPIRSAGVRFEDIDSGGYSCGAPPLPIPNREVKPARADGTAPQSGRVGRRRLREGLLAGFPAGRFFFCTIKTVIIRFIGKY